MYTRRKISQENTSTPKRRRLGVGRILRPSLQFSGIQANILQGASSAASSPLSRNDDDRLPCNQIEFLGDSENNISTSSIPCSPGVLDSSIMKSIENWESLVVSKTPKNIKEDASNTISKELSELDDMSDEMFITKLEQESTQCNQQINHTLMTSRCEKHFREHIEDSFDIVSKSICNLPLEEKTDKSALFETKDSFLLNIQESAVILEHKDSKSDPYVQNTKEQNNRFYGLPIMVKELFKTYRNIEKFYDWQEECLNLEAIIQRRNLIYALPTSGGKTLVAEVLMLREVINRRRNALFILPFVAIVQEKMWSLSPFAVQLDFLVEEYAAGKGLMPPKKRRKKSSVYVATIEKGLALVRSLIELERLGELGLIVVDELHLIGEPGRGATLETLLATVLFTKQDIQIVGMSATIGNLPDLARFLRADVFARQFRPVQLAEFVKLGDVLHRLVWSPAGLEVVPERQLEFNYSAAGARADPDRLGGLVAEVVPAGGCLVFCPTQRNCESVAWLLSRLQRKEMVSHRAAERAALASALCAEGAGAELARCVRAGVACHHAGLAADERALLERAFRAGVISVLCCTSTLAAGVNLPARRVLVRAPRVGRAPLSLAAYRQMAGRAGRAGVCAAGDSIIICSDREWPSLREVLGGGLAPARSVLTSEAACGLLLSAVQLRLATDRAALHALLRATLLATQEEPSGTATDIKQLCDDALRTLIKSGALEVTNRRADTRDKERCGADESRDCVVYSDSVLAVSKLGRAAIKGCMELSTATQLVRELRRAARGTVLAGPLHLLFLVAPREAAVRPDYGHYYSLYCSLDEEGVQTAKTLGITEMNAVRMMTGKPITDVPENVLARFYLALMLRDLWNQVPFPVVAQKYNVSRGLLQSVMTSAASFAWSAHRVCEELEPLWPFQALLGELAPRLRHCAAPELHQLMELPAVKKARAMQLLRAGYKRIEDVAKASAEDLAACIEHLSQRAAQHLVSAARMMLIEKVENLRAEAEDVMEELNV